MKLFFIALLALLPLWGHAQLRVDVSGVGAVQIPVAIPPFVAEGVGTDIAAIVRRDLDRTKQFRFVEAAAPLSEQSPVQFTEWRARGAEALAVGSVNRLGSGRYEVRYQLNDVLKQSTLDRMSFAVGEADLRFAAHRIADQIYEKLTGERGIFSTRLAYVTKTGGRYRLLVSDWDLQNAHAAITSGEPIISPVWSPDGSRIAYVSFESQKPVVYVQDLGSEKRWTAANFKGSNSAPSFSPDGRQLAVALTRDGLSQIYLVQVDGSNPRRLTTSGSIDTEPRFSPDGSSVYFTSDRGGSPQIYRVPAGGGEAARLTFNHPYNVSPRPSPDGKKLAYVSRRDGRFLVVVRDLASGAEQVLSKGGREESPSFAPNGRWVLYTSHQAGREILMATSIDGQVTQTLTGETGTQIREPAWGPFLGAQPGSR